MWRGTRIAAVLGLTLAATVTGAAQAAPHASPVSIASAELRDAGGASIGRAVFIEAGRGGVRVIVFASGQAPGLHGLHIHAVGSCVGPTFASAGAHFNPTNSNHGMHAGDLPDLEVGPSGVGVVNTTSTAFTLQPGPLSLFDADGAALVIHANPDDHVTNPSGNSGARIACGEISRIV